VGGGGGGVEHRRHVVGTLAAGLQEVELVDGLERQVPLDGLQHGDQPSMVVVVGVRRRGAFGGGVSVSGPLIIMLLLRHMVGGRGPRAAGYKVLQQVVAVVPVVVDDDVAKHAGVRLGLGHQLMMMLLVVVGGVFHVRRRAQGDALLADAAEDPVVKPHGVGGGGGGPAGGVCVEESVLVHHPLRLAALGGPPLVEDERLLHAQAVRAAGRQDGLVRSRRLPVARPRRAVWPGAVRVLAVTRAEEEPLALAEHSLVCNYIILEQLQQFAKSTWHSRIFAKTIKNSLQQVGKTTWQFCELDKIFPSLGKYAKSSITWHYVYHNLPTSFANLLEPQFCDFGKNTRMSSSFAKSK